MSVWAVTMVKDEADVLEGTLRHLASERVDGIIVADNGSTDGTLELLEQLRLRCELVVVEDPEVGYYQSRKMSALASMAADHGAEWIVPFDADELWIAPDEPLASSLERLPADVALVPARLVNHLRTGEDVSDPDPFRSMVWRAPEPVMLPKVAFRWMNGAVVGAGNHVVRLPSTGNVLEGFLEVRHFPSRSAAQFRRKAINGALAYAATDLPEGTGQHWRDYGRLAESNGPEVLEDVYEEHWYYPTPADAGLVRDPARYRRWET